MASPTSRTLKVLREAGWPLVQTVEHWVPKINIRRDLFGIIDVLAVHPEWGVLAVQCTDGSNASKRVDKIVASDALQILRLVGWRVVVHGWRKNAKNRWVLREEDVS